MLNFTNSKTLFDKSQHVIPGGVNSPVRAFRAVGGTPIFFSEGHGAYLWDVDGNKFIDYVGSWGPAILGHAHPEVVRAVQERAAKGMSFGAPTEAELHMAERLCALLPSIEQVRLTSSGTEATMSAIRLARGFTGRNKIVKFEGCYHGHGDALLVKAGSGALTFGNPSSAGVPADVVAHTIVLNYNDIDDAENCFRKMGDEIACVIIEPVAGNMNFVVPSQAYMAVSPPGNSGALVTSGTSYTSRSRWQQSPAAVVRVDALRLHPPRNRTMDTTAAAACKEGMLRILFGVRPMYGQSHQTFQRALAS